MFLVQMCLLSLLSFPLSPSLSPLPLSLPSSSRLFREYVDPVSTFSSPSLVKFRWVRPLLVHYWWTAKPSHHGLPWILPTSTTTGYNHIYHRANIYNGGVQMVTISPENIRSSHPSNTVGSCLTKAVTGLRRTHDERSFEPPPPPLCGRRCGRSCGAFSRRLQQSLPHRYT